MFKNFTSDAEFARKEERITKIKAKELYDKGYMDQVEVVIFKGLAQFHRFLFSEAYDFVGEV
ncbi:hypothetical protein TK11N_12410 [Tetragenococcus koreensis]|uniref:Cell filamentation protein Fic n=1 Tax=Tetragenococcus koreensis TaxID=290335 RepID=A0AAN4RKX3_9ENTE|nr:hypothetical protein TKO01_00950 [Tetragenococcus koreensis]GEQ49389.1 hypothetical protein TK11N_12410 [Tetragenococcus koreensis]GEQ51914.1 hypothetical protein TK12N_12580 [Tetragenococcus koreensis]GEQ54449.1 hypothetical protein TK2N_12930 [Tetragenococcus koreensis]GEQ56916.1 hypothetical protein TK4N_12590 [Tetragenococcus koreensis]